MKTAIVTGASGKIGGAIAKLLSINGFSVFGQYNENKNGIDIINNELESLGVKERVYPVKFDMASESQIKSAFLEIEKKTSKIDVLVNCAGEGLYKLANQTTLKEWNDLFSINVGGAHQLTSLALDKMISNKSGKIVFISSIWGNVGASMEAAYSASKAALIGYTKALAKEVGPSGITVNCVCPGVIDTPMNARFTKEEMDELIYSTPIGRIGEPSDVAKLTAFLVSGDADFITGQIITVDGGLTL